jgi:ABC-type transport system involved in multi-copper enzyme maturation permease subunit
MTAATADRGEYRLTFPRLAAAQARAFLGGAAAGWGLLAVLGLALASGAAGFVGLPAGQNLDPLPAVNAALLFAAVGLHLYAIAVGSDAIAGEFARGTIGASLAIVPRRGLLFGAKALTACGAVVAAGILTGIVAGGSTLLVAALFGHQVEGLTIAAWLVGTAGLACGGGILALLALALGTLTRQRLVAVLVPIVAQYLLPLLVGLLLTGTTRDRVFALLPGPAMTALATTQVQGGVLTVGTTISAEVALPSWGALLVLAGWCALVVPAAVVSFLRRDISTVSTARTRTPQRVAAHPAARRRAYRATAARLLGSELRKSWSLPSVRWIFAVSTLLLLAFGIARAATGSLENRGRTPIEALSNEFSYAVTGGVGGVALLLAALAAIQVAGEFETGTAVSTFIAAPRRWQVTSSKLAAAALSSVILALPGLVLTALLAAAIYAGRGYAATPEVIAAGALVTAKALLFLLLTTVMSAGIAGLTRRSVTTIIAAAFLLVVGPALLNTVRGFAQATESPLVAVGNAARFLPWEGARFFYPVDGANAFAAIDDKGILQVSAEFGITMTALWAIVAVAAWFAADARRPITVR